MKPLYTNDEYQKAKSRDKLPFSCYHCNNIFYIEKHHINSRSKLHKIKFCSNKCQRFYQHPSTHTICANCSKPITKLQSSYQKSKTKLFFCNSSCSATYNNTHKTYGYRRSKLEKWLETQLKILYPNLQILFNNKTAINSELDIYFPQLKLAFELNGIFHYEPIYGTSTLTKIQNNDNRKFQACLENTIELCIIDVSTFEYFKPDRAQKYLNIITNIVNQKNGTSGES